MSKSSGGVRQVNVRNNKTKSAAVKLTPQQQKEHINQVKRAIERHTVVNRWNDNTAYTMGWNDDAQDIVSNVAKGNYGFASDVAKTVVARNYRSISEKQAYVIARAAVENNVSGVNKGIFEYSAPKPAKKAARTSSSILPKKDNVVAALKRRGMTGTQAWRLIKDRWGTVTSGITTKIKTGDLADMFLS